MGEQLDIRTRSSGLLRISVRTALIMLVFTTVFTALMSGAYRLTAERVAASEQEEKRRLIGEVLPPGSYDNDLLQDALTLPPQPQLGLTAPSTLWRARLQGQPAALVLEAAAPDGYSGRIGLLLAISADGRLLAQRVTNHRETPGLGDYIDPRKDRNKARPWITQFNGRGFDSVPAERWRVKKDGGVYDQMAGATISARAVTNASRRALQWVAEHKAQLFALPAQSRYEGN